MARVLRERIVDELTQKYKDTNHCVFIDFSGLNVESTIQLRRQIGERGMEFFVVKNSLLKLALEKIGLPAEESLFLRPTAIVSGGEDPVVASKVIVNWQKKAKKTEIKGGLLDRKLLTGEEVVELSQLPSRKEQLSQILGVFIAPVVNIANLLNNSISQFANLLHNHIEKLGKEG